MRAQKKDKVQKEPADEQVIDVESAAQTNSPDQPGKKRKRVKKPPSEQTVEKPPSAEEATVAMTTKQANKERDEDERHLESLVFGLQSDLVAELQRPASPQLDDADADSLFRLDRRGDADDEEADVPAETTRRPAWEDEDDENVTVAQVTATFAGERRRLPADTGSKYRATLQKKFSAVVGEPEWANLDRKRRHDSDDERDDDAESLLTKTGRLLATGDKPARIPKGSIQTKKCSDLSANMQGRPRTISAVEFHPSSQVALVGGGGRDALALVQVDGAENPLVQMVPVEAGFRVQCAHFSADGEHVVASSERAGHLFSYNMMSGRTQRVDAGRRLGLHSVASFTVSPDGRWIAVPGPRAGAVHLLSSRSKEWVDTLQASGRVTALAFSPDGTRLYTHSDEGHVYEWDMTARQCVHRFVDEGCLAGTAVSMSPDGRLLACGSSSGVVNVYEAVAARRKEHPAPVKVLDHLTTQCDQLLFNATSELMAMASAQKEHAVRLVHVPSMTVYSDFPGWSQAVREPHRLDFSLSSGYLAIGNNKGRALLYRLQHYDSY